MEPLGLAVLVGATVASGLLAGAFVLYAHTVMPALRRADDATFVETFTRLDHQIVNPWFMLSAFLGGPVLSLVAAITVDGDVRRWCLVALALHVAMILVTGAVNVPRNDALKGAPAGSDPGALRAAFDEARWARWNLVRVLLSCGATGVLAWALVVAQPV
jgi:uncharacterized membrane protein